MDPTQIEFQIHSGGTSINIEESATNAAELVEIIARIMILSAQVTDQPLRSVLNLMSTVAMAPLADKQ